jgi:hypothetical protein
MILRGICKRRLLRLWKDLVQPEDLPKVQAYVNSLTEGQAFRLLFFQMTILRGADRQQLGELQRMIEEGLHETQQDKTPPAL